MEESPRFQASSKPSAKVEGLFVGVSSGASPAAVKKANKKGKILTFCYDTGERYLSITGLFEF